MTNYEYLRGLSAEQLASEFCDLMADVNKYGCDVCPKKDKCSYGRSGFWKWLEDERG